MDDDFLLDDELCISDVSWLTNLLKQIEDNDKKPEDQKDQKLLMGVDMGKFKVKLQKAKEFAQTAPEVQAKLITSKSKGKLSEGELELCNFLQEFPTF